MNLNPLLIIIFANLLISLISFVGVACLALKKKVLEKIISYLVAFAAGSLLGGVFLHILPEVIELIPLKPAFMLLIAGFIFFLILEKILHWRHCHEAECPIHAFAYVNLLGDTVHNFLDGLTIAASFLTSFSLGIATFLAIIFHEIPQELGDFGVFVYAGIKIKRALFLNFLSALAAVLGGIIGFYLQSLLNFQGYVLSFTAGGFLYIAASDLIPEIKKELKIKKSLMNFFFFLAGIVIFLVI